MRKLSYSLVCGMLVVSILMMLWWLSGYNFDHRSGEVAMVATGIILAFFGTVCCWYLDNVAATMTGFNSSWEELKRRHAEEIGEKDNYILGLINRHNQEKMRILEERQSHEGVLQGKLDTSQQTLDKVESRLLMVVDNEAFIVDKVVNGTKLYYLITQDQDERFVHLGPPDAVSRTKMEAIDAAIANTNNTDIVYYDPE